MIQGKTDPRRPDKVQRYKAPQANGNNPVEDLTPDYMNILGPEPARAGGGAAVVTANTSHESPPPVVQAGDDPATTECDASAIPQYGVALLTDPAYKLALPPPPDVAADNKDTAMHSTPSRTNTNSTGNNDRFKVVKIATLEPFRRGRWKCMDYVDENPPVSASATCRATAHMAQYMQTTQSLPQQHFQQMQQQFYQNMSAAAGGATGGGGGAQVQFFYPPQSAAQPQSTTATYVSGGAGAGGAGAGAGAGGATYYQQVIPNSGGGMTLVNYPGVQYVPANMLQTQAGSAFVPTAQNINTTAQLPQNMQQGQTYAGPSSNVTPSTQQQQPLVNGHAFPPPNVAEQQTTTIAAQQTAPITSTLPTHAQVAKGVILGAPVPTAQYTVTQQHTAPPTAIYQNNTSTQVTPIASSAIVTPSSIQPPISNQSATNTSSSSATNGNTNLMDATSAAAAAAAVYSNPQFVASVNKIVESAVSMIDAAAAHAHSPTQRSQMEPPSSEVTEPPGPAPSCSATGGEDMAAKANPVVNAIDNKIEQAMDLVKSHLMFTVREEVEVLKEKIAELMEKIQQLESENSMLRLQVPAQKQHVILPQQHNTNAPTDTTAPSSGGQQQ